MLEITDDAKHHLEHPDQSVFRRQFVATAIALMALIGIADIKAPVAAAKPAALDAESCEAAWEQSKPTRACPADARESVSEANRDEPTGDARAVRADGEHTRLAENQELRSSFEQALIDDTSGNPVEARRRYDLFRGTPMERIAAVPSAVNLAVLGRFDEANVAFAALSGSADTSEAGYAQLWKLWLEARTWRGEVSALREKLARDTVGLRAADARQQALLNLFAGQGSVDAVFGAIEASTPENSPRRRDARTEAAFFAGGYVQYVLRDAAAAQRLYLRELPQSVASVERPMIQQSIRSL